MKATINHSFTFLLITLLTSTFLSAQVIDSSVVSPLNPGPNDTIKIYTYLTFNSGPCAGSANFNQSGFNIGASSLHCLGVLAVICHDVDTVILNPPHNQGTYTFAYVLSMGIGGPPCSPGIVPSDYDTITFNVSTTPPPPVNKAPTVSNYEGDSICKNDSLGPIAFSFTDENINNLLVSASSDNQSVVSNNGLILTGNGSSRDLLIVPGLNSVGLANITVLVEDTGALKDSVVFPIKVYQCSTGTGIKYESPNLYSIFPNPATSYVLIESSQLNIQEITLYNTIGELVEVEVNSHSKEGKIDVSNLDRGIYVIQVNLGGLHVYREKIMIE